jgi:hypothetical protein
MSEEEIPNVKEALNEYFRLKKQFENQNNVHKKRIINNQTLSKKEKRAEYLKLMPKCVNCKRPSRKGTIFSIIYHPADDKISEHRTFKVLCGDLADPCNLNIEFNVGNREHLDELMVSIRKEIKETKDKIIDDKNKLLFGLLTTETALENFDDNKNYITELTSVYERYLDIWNKEMDNPEKKLELEEALVQSYENINAIKDCIKKMNELNDIQYAVDAANIYHNVLEPLLIKIRQLKYKENSVYNNDNNKTCNLIQKKFTVDNLLVTSYDDKIVSYDIGLKIGKTKKKQPGLIIEDEDEEAEPEEKIGKISIKINEPKPIGEVEEDEPIIGQGKDGIAWNNPKYQKVWDRLSPKLKAEFKVNIEWMKDFMNKCVNNRESGKACDLTTPPNLVLPPRKMENGQYDFGVSIYNKAFNSLPQSLQNTYLTLYKEDPQTKVKNYKMLEDAMNELVKREVNFGSTYFKGFF